MVRQRMINNAEVLCATCVGAGGGMLERCVFERVLVDEAGQATELATVVALSRGCKQLALVVRSSKTLSLNQSTFSSKMASHICAVRLIDCLIDCAAFFLVSQCHGCTQLVFDQSVHDDPLIALF